MYPGRVAMTGAPSTADTGYRSNLAALAAAQKPARGTAAYGRYVNRPAGRRVAALGHVVGMTPNVASVISATMSGVGILVLAVLEPTWATGLVVAALLAGGYVMDSVDGQLARLRGGGSVSGEWLDHTIDCFKTSLLHLAVLVSWFRFPPVDPDAALLVPVGYEVVQVTLYFGLILVPFLRAKAAARVPVQPAGAVPAHAADEHPARKWLILPTDYGFLCWLFVLMGWPLAFFWAYAGMAALSAGMLGLALRKWWRELRELDRLAV